MKKLGTFAGVFVPSFEAILGAVLFLILPLLVGAVGLWNVIIIVVLANTATLATAFSIADSSSNVQKVGAGGMYALSRHSLGMAFGGSIGIQLFIAQAASIGFYAVGFAQPLQQFMVRLPLVASAVETYGISVLVQQQIIATGIGFIAMIAALAGADFASKLQSVIFVILVASVALVLLSPVFTPQNSGEPIFTAAPLGRSLVPGIGFWAAFATFFPAVTGIDAGVGMSGSLKTPGKSLARGTFLAIAVTFVVYVATSAVFGFIRHDLLTPAPGYIPSTINIFMEEPIILTVLLTGILFATGSSALSYFLTAPRTAQALVRDRVLPRSLRFLGMDFVRQGREPRVATVVTFLIFLPVIWAGDIAIASLIVGICFLVVYAWMNMAAFFERISGNPSFRPTSKGHWIISLYGFLVCIMVIVLFDYRIGIGVIGVQLIMFYLLLKYRAGNMLEGVWWGLLFSSLSWGMKRLGHIVQGTKNWRPIMGVFGFADRNEEVERLHTMARRIGEYRGFVAVNIMCPRKLDPETVTVPPGARLIRSSEDRFGTAIRTIAQAASPGGFKFNTVVVPMDTRLNLTDLIRDLMEDRVNVILSRHGKVEIGANRIDVYWKGKENGNLMALLAYIVSQSWRREQKGYSGSIRIIRKLREDEDRQVAREEMEALMNGARLGGEVLLLEPGTEPFPQTVAQTSADAALVLLGMPGKPMHQLAQAFELDELFFTRQVQQYEGMPPMLFVKAAGVFDLFA
ncbi:amino acid permease [Alkalispirochaeta sphaeroplastigenens]|uniref:Amino acid permease n=1 Tax=Alkalispirochaeta sphaeroplastigenens TaxID=1187066 RepID=A0A2S4JHF7_9SPIO|nr:amino acid permease [Alkalispirochaeta sphaeroplastigenens]POQ98943.1 amino acid permease [Alkalispirochaeta sphaeroplastigenens]